MFDTLFGAEIPLAVRFFLAFLIVLGLIGATAWAVRRFGAGRLGAGTRGRQPRLAVIDYASVDGRRRLILVRRDNVEHLLMIGGPTDVVVEPNIVRATAAPRDMPGVRPTAGMDALPRAIPLPENGNGGWPLAPESSVGLRAPPRLEPLPDELPQRPFQPIPDLTSPAETSFARTPPARPPRDTLAALADELSMRPTPPAPPRKPAEPRQETRQETRQESRPEPRQEFRPEPRKPITQPVPAIIAAPPPAPAEAPSADDQSLADMAQRLEAALRKPEATPSATPAAPPAPPQPRTARPNEIKPARQDAKPASGTQGTQGKTDKIALYDSLEQEMASLLGRPTKP